MVTSFDLSLSKTACNSKHSTIYSRMSYASAEIHTT